MRVIAGVFAVSVIAIVSVIPARAEVVSTELLNKRLGTEGNLATVAHTGSYNDLANKPTIPAAQVQTDWNATSGMGAIKNKPTLGTLAGKSAVTAAEITDGTITTNDISATAGIKKEQLAADVQTSLDKADTALQAHQDISGKEDKSNIVKSTEALDTLKTSEDRYPSMAAANKIAQTHAQAAVSGAAASYQVKSTAAYQMGGANGAWTTMSTDQQNALNSKVTAAKVTAYDGYATTIASKQDKSTAVTHTAKTAAGDSTHPVYVSASGVATKIDKVAAAAKADTAGSATKATQDASGNTITTTYATKTELTNGLAGKQDALTPGAYITITKDASTGKTTIASTGPTYTLPAATANALGGVKSGGNITVTTDGAVTVNQATNATNATTATNAKKICSGSTCTAFVDIWVE